jgi:serine/threonine protein kinase
MEFAGRINLCQRLFRRDAGHEDLPAAKAKSIMSQLIDALAFFHRVAKVAHGDIKSENIIINENEMDITAKIVDFDMAMRADDTTRAVDACGTFPFIAPELVLDRRPLVLPTDVWSTGVVLLEIVCYCRCLEQTLKIHRGTTMKSHVLSQLLMTIRVWFQQSQALASLLESRLRFELREMMGASKVLIEGMLQSEPSKRFTASELLEVIPLLSEGIASELVGSAGSLRPRSVHSGYQ